MVGSQSVLGIIPVGRGNDLPRNLGIAEDLDSALDLLKKGRIRKIDVIQVNSDQYMFGVGGIGFDAEVNFISNRLNSFLGGNMAYVLPVLYKSLTYRPKAVSVRMDNEVLQGPVLMVAFRNIKSYGKGMQITPLAEPDDGLLDVCWVDPVKTLRLYRLSRPSLLENILISLKSTITASPAPRWNLQRLWIFTQTGNFFAKPHLPSVSFTGFYACSFHEQQNAGSIELAGCTYSDSKRPR